MSYYTLPSVTQKVTPTYFTIAEDHNQTLTLVQHVCIFHVILSHVHSCNLTMKTQNYSITVTIKISLVIP